MKLSKFSHSKIIVNSLDDKNSKYFSKKWKDFCFYCAVLIGIYGTIIVVILHFHYYFFQVKQYNVKLPSLNSEISNNYRSVKFNFISENECNQLITIVKENMNSLSNISNNNELYVLTSDKFSSLNSSSLNLIYNIRHKMLQFVRQSFPDEEINFEHTQLTYRKKGATHTVHCDRCFISINWSTLFLSIIRWFEWNFDSIFTCIPYDDDKYRYCCGWRSHTMIIYLNEVTEGGEFYFYNRDAITQPTFIKPKPGTAVAFSTGFENPHGIHEIVKGDRYTLAVWFTTFQDRFEYLDI